MRERVGVPRHRAAHWVGLASGAPQRRTVLTRIKPRAAMAAATSLAPGDPGPASDEASATTSVPGTFWNKSPAEARRGGDASPAAAAATLDAGGAPTTAAATDGPVSLPRSARSLSAAEQILSMVGDTSPWQQAAGEETPRSDGTTPAAAPPDSIEKAPARQGPTEHVDARPGTKAQWRNGSGASNAAARASGCPSCV